VIRVNGNNSSETTYFTISYNYTFAYTYTTFKLSDNEFQSIV